MKRLFFGIAILFSLRIFAQSTITKDQAIADIDYFNTVLNEVHYNPFLFVNKEKYYEKTDALKNSLHDTVELKDLIHKFYHLTSIINDSHTSPALVQPALRNELMSDIFLPFLIVRDENRLYISKSASEKLNLEAGSEVLSINGNTIDGLLKDFDNCFGGTKAFSKEMATRVFSYFLMLKGIMPPYKIISRNTQNKKATTTIHKGTTFRNALALTIPSLKKKYDFQIVDNKLGLFSFLSMSENLNVLDHYMDSCITLIKNKNIKYLAIDLRDNSGGNSALADLLISYFYKNSYSLMGKRDWKISQKYKDYLISKGDTTNQYLSKTNGTIWELGNCTPHKPLFENNNIFDGKVFLITGPFTFSSANMFADGAKNYKIAEIIGAGTGETTNDFGEVYSFELPNSKIKMQTTTSFDYGVSCKEKSFEPVKADYEITIPLKSKIREEDFVLKKLLERIK